MTETRMIATRVGQLHVEIRGDGPVVLCWPSLYCDATTVEPVVHDLARDHRLIVIEGPAHGRSGGAPGPFTIADCAGAAIEILDALGIQRVVWLGPAWGGHVGVCAARRHADRLLGLVVLNAPMTAWRGRNLLMMRLGYTLLWVLGTRSFVASMIAGTMIAPNAPERDALVALLVSSLHRCERRTLLPVIHACMFGRTDYTPWLHEVHVPTVVFAGAEDSLLPVEEARAHAALIPDCRFVVVERSSHQSALEAPQFVLPIIREALREWTRSDAVTPVA